ncbi:meckelin [Aureococcus anophagefferens]|uniref:Meckelin n=1 Tax=Aureococcus anophagefferens TaxID=44056 RepID=A0ABR1FR85_AURAN
MKRLALLLWVALASGAAGDEGAEEADENEPDDDIDYWARAVVADPGQLRCGSAEFYDTIDMRCAPCADMGDDALVGDGRYADGAGNALRCRCPVGSRLFSLAEGCDVDGRCGALRCLPCAETSASDNSVCLACDNATTTGVDAATGDCGCGGHQRLVERDFGGALLDAKTCVACAPGLFVTKGGGVFGGVAYDGDRYACRRCPDPRMAYSATDGACECPAPYELAGVESVGAQTCVDAAQLGLTYAAYPEAAAVRVPYRNVQSKPNGDADGVATVASETFRHYYGAAAAGCLYYDGTAAAARKCQALANLCALTQYDLGSTPCRLYDDLASLRATRNTWGAKDHLPWLFYDRDGDAVRSDGALQMEMAFTSKDRGRDHKLRFRLAKYALGGDFLGYEELNTQLFYCEAPAPSTGSGGGAAKDTSWVRYGYSLRDHFTCDLRSLWAREQVLYDLYLVDTEGLCDGAEAAAVADDGAERTECLYPVPVLNKGLKNRDGKGVNKNGKTEDGDDDIFVRRFALFDVASGVDDEAEVYGSPAMTRFLVEAKLHVIGKTKNPERFFVPYLELKYRERSRADILGSEGMRETEVDVEVEYSKSSRPFWRVADGFAYFLLAVVGLTWLHACRHWQLRHYAVDSANLPTGGFTVAYLVNVIVLLGRIGVHIFFPFVFILCSYYFVFFKLQEAAYTLLPAENRHDGKDFEYYPVRTAIISMWAFQTAVVLQIVVRMCQMEIFFVDWEPPRKPDVGKAAPVSVWRTIFVANEFSEMMTARRTSTHFVLFCLGFFLVAMGLENNATPQPDLGDLTAGHRNIALRFANTTWWWLILAFGQWLWNFYVYERFISEPVAQSFVDVCTVAKVSVVVFDSEYHGWYIHGDASYEHADDTMAALTDHLLHEASAGHAQRGLEPTLPNVTVFQMWLTPQFRRAWRSVQHKRDPSRASGGAGRRSAAVRASLPPPALGEAKLGSRSLFGGGRSESLASRMRKSHAAEKIAVFLKTFLGHGYKDKFALDWVAKETNLLERLTYATPQRTTPHVILQPDRTWFLGDDSWTAITFLGHDWEILMQEILTFAVADIWFRSTSLSIFLTFLLHHAIRLLCASYCEANIADSSYVDQRFLL